MKKLFTADPHYGHDNIRAIVNRPFGSLEEMDEVLIDNHNTKVNKNDDVYILGDFCWRDTDFDKYFSRLNGNIHFLEGNHDEVARANQDKFASYQNFLEIEVEGVHITLCHYPMRTWNYSHKGSWNLFGHEHGNLGDDRYSLSIDVGVDCHNFFPLDFSEVRDIMGEKKSVFVFR